MAIDNVSMVIYVRYAERVHKLQQLVAQTVSATDEPAFRLLRIPQHLLCD